MVGNSLQMPGDTAMSAPKNEVGRLHATKLRVDDEDSEIQSRS